MAVQFKNQKKQSSLTVRSESPFPGQGRTTKVSVPTAPSQARTPYPNHRKNKDFVRPPHGNSASPQGSSTIKDVYAIRFSRDDWTKILVLTAAFTLIGALFIDYLNSGRNVVRALVVVGPIIAFLALGFWLFPSPRHIRLGLRSLQHPRYPRTFRHFSQVVEKHLLPRVIPMNVHRDLFDPNTKQRGNHKKSQEIKKKNLPSRLQGRIVGDTAPGDKDTLGHSKRVQTLGTSNLKLWNDPSPRLNVNLFESNVPTFVLSADQHFVDWNAGFDLAFALPLNLKRGQHVSEWFDRLDNFKKISKRREQLYGEGILPITDRERATFKHPSYGRMVYTKIMSPIIDLKSSKIIGWTIVLNINSVNKRREFFEDLFRVIQEEGRRIRYRAAYPDVFKHYEGRRHLIDAHLQMSHVSSTSSRTMLHPSHLREKNTRDKILIWGPDSVALTAGYIQLGYRVTVFSDDVHLLRRVRSDYGGPEPLLKLIRKESNQDLPEDYFQKASVMFDTGSLDHYRSILQDVYRALEHGGTLTLSAITDAAGLERIFQASFEALQKGGHMEQMKHQFHHVRDYALDQSRSPNHVVLDRVTLRQLAMEAGFVIVSESELHQETSTTLLELKK